MIVIPFWKHAIIGAILPAHPAPADNLDSIQDSRLNALPALLCRQVLPLAPTVGDERNVVVCHGATSNVVTVSSSDQTMPNDLASPPPPGIQSGFPASNSCCIGSAPPPMLRATA